MDRYAKNLIILFLLILMYGCSQGQNDKINKPQEQAIVKNTPKEFVLTKDGLECIKFFSNIENAISILSEMNIEVNKGNLDTFINLKSPTVNGENVFEIVLDFGNNNSLKHIGIVSNDSSLEDTSKFVNKFKNIFTTLYGRPKFSTEDFNSNDKIIGSWISKDSVKINSILYKYNSGKYSVVYSIIPSVSVAILASSTLTKSGKRIRLKHPDWDEDTCNTIGSGKINIGMTTEQVRASWGRPYAINRTTTANRTTEQWVMHELGKTYVYFEDGICTAIQN